MKLKVTCLLAVVSMAALITGCSNMNPFDAEASGIFAGKALYAVYTRNINKQPKTVKRKIDDLWVEINKIEDVSDLTVVRTLVNERFEAILADSKLTESDKVILTLVKDDVVHKLDSVINDKAASNKEGLAFLIGVRKGVNEMIAVYETP